MGILDTVIGGLMGNSGASSPMGSILSSILGGGGQTGGFGSGSGNAGAGGSQMGGSQMGGSAMGGGLGGLLSQFQNAGLGHLAESWIGHGQNQPVSPGQLQDVFGENQVNGMAQHAGMQPGDFLSQLSQHLPNAVNGMTPNGKLPDEGTMSV